MKQVIQSDGKPVTVIVKEGCFLRTLNIGCMVIIGFVVLVILLFAGIALIGKFVSP